jgi:hypothetical protein
MTDHRFLKTAVEISNILGVSDRTITRWAMNGKVAKFGRGEYSIISVFKCYRQLLIEQIHRSNDNIAVAQNTIVKKSLQQEKMEASIKIITSNALIKEHEIKILEGNLVNREEAGKVFNNACREFTAVALQLPKELANDLALSKDPNEIKSILEQKINELLSHLSIQASYK